VRALTCSPAPSSEPSWRATQSVHAGAVHLAAPAIEESTFRVVRGEVARSSVCQRCLFPSAQATQQIGARGVKQVVAIELAKRIPAVERGSVEIRPIWELPPEYAEAGAAATAAN
jgi:hypothetical protein